MVTHSNGVSAQAPRVPRATYRMQFNRHFTFRDAAELVPYLDDLGISDLYASPYLQARPGSMHGYDISNHDALNPEIGTEADHEALTRLLREHGMGHLVDIVPNHMGIGGGINPWWMDVLENGPSSRYAPFFDIDWHPLQPELTGKVLLPVLGDQFGNVLERGELKLRYEQGRFWIDYFENPHPVAPKSAVAVLREALDSLSLPAGDLDRLELESIAAALEHLPPRHHTDLPSRAERERERVVTHRRLSALYDQSAEVRSALDKAIDLFNGRVGGPESFDRLEDLLDHQAYRLAFWRVAAEEINYRRFFNINDLAGVRVERPEVFQQTHKLLLRLLAEGKLTGFRIDHPDGLYDPAGYLRHLQREAVNRSPDAPPYIVVEKILTGDEQLPKEWPVAGTVGYEFLNWLNGLFVATEKEPAMDAAYREFQHRIPEFGDLAYEKKKVVLRSALASELNVLAHLLATLSEWNRRSRDFTLSSLTEALRETIACFPVYRTYINAETGKVTERDREWVEHAIRRAKRRNRSTNASIFDFLRDTLLLQWPEDLNEDERLEHARFVMKFQQLTGPVTAKGVEDTAFYIYNRLTSLNEVGGEPAVFGTSTDDFHRNMADRMELWPQAMNSTSTHDTKRSEDVRARLNVLSEIPGQWAEHVSRWAAWNASTRAWDEGQPIPDRNDEYLLYQTLIGAWPLQTMDETGHARFIDRIQEYMGKATREAKVHTSWINPNEHYEEGFRDFIARVLCRDETNAFLDDFTRFQATIAPLGMLNSLSQVLLKLTCPGVPDIYQGQEVWDFSLVDPDNRRPVNYELRRSMLDELRSRLRGGDRQALAKQLVRHWPDGRIKLFVTHLALELRREHPDVFHHGTYTPLAVTGSRSKHGVAFARDHAGEQIVVAVPRLVASLASKGDRALPDFTSWDDFRVAGKGLEGRYQSVFTGRDVTAEGGDLEVAELLDGFPVALLVRHTRAP